MNMDKTLLAVQIAGMAAMVWMTANASDDGPIGVGDRAPEFSVVADDGRAVSRDDFGGKLLMINFWATWCPPCLYEMPALNEFARLLQSRGLMVLAVSFDEDDEQYRGFLQQMQPAFLTTRAGGRELAASFGTFRIPETYIIDRRGRVVRKYVNARDWMDPAILNDIRDLLR